MEKNIAFVDLYTGEKFFSPVYKEPHLPRPVVNKQKVMDTWSTVMVT